MRWLLPEAEVLIGVSLSKKDSVTLPCVSSFSAESCVAQLNHARHTGRRMRESLRQACASRALAAVREVIAFGDDVDVQQRAQQWVGFSDFQQLCSHRS